MHQPSAFSTNIFFPSNNFSQGTSGRFLSAATNFLFGNYGLRRAERGEDMPSETSEGIEN